MSSNLKILKRLSFIEGLVEQINKEAIMLRKEISGSGASSISSRKGLSEEEEAKIKAKRAKNRIK